MRKRMWLLLGTVALGLCGCESAHVGMAVPIPGPVKPTVGMSINKSGVKGSAGVGATVGKVPVHVGGTTKPLPLTTEKSKTTQPKE